MSKFWIREGDALPVIKNVIVDATGAIVDLTNAQSVALEMRKASDGSVFATHTGAMPAPKTGGVVQYTWLVADTLNKAGEYLCHWIVTWSGGDVQSFPTDTAIDVVIASASGAVNGYTPDVLLEARQRSGEVGDTNFTDVQIAALLAKRTGDTAAVACDIWALKASDAANLVDMSESGGSRSLGRLYQQCLEMSKYWGDQSPVIQASLRTPDRKRGAVTRGIERV